MNHLIDFIAILVGVLLIIVSRPLAEFNVKQYERWSERWFGPMVPSPQHLHWVYKLLGAAFCLVGVTSILGNLK